MRPVITLPPDALTEARDCAATRLSDALLIGAHDRFDSNSLDSHFWGRLGERALASYLGLPCPCTSGVWAVPDVGPYECRAIPLGTRVYVKAKPNDPGPRLIAVVALHPPTATILGWIRADEVRRLAPLSDPGDRGAPCHMLRGGACLRALTPFA